MVQKKGFASRQTPSTCLRNGGSSLAVTLFETLNATGCVNQFLLAGVERMAGRTDLGIDLFFCRTCQESVSADAANGYLGIHWVNTFFHLFLLQSCFTALN
jgi:hypothetical protein